MFALAALEPTDNNSCGPVPVEENGHPWPRQNRVTNATPQSKTSNISKFLLTRLKSYRYCLNHSLSLTHTHTILSLHARVSRAAVSPLNLVCLIPNTRTVSTWTPHYNAKSLKRNRLRNQHTTSSDFHSCNISLYDG